MPKPELLVHVTASARMHDDKRYLTLAQSILDFQPVTRINISVNEPTGITCRNHLVFNRSTQSQYEKVLRPVSSVKTQGWKHLDLVATPKLAQSQLSVAAWKRSKPRHNDITEGAGNTKTSLVDPSQQITIPEAERETSCTVVRSPAASKLRSSVVEVPYTGHKRERSAPESSICQTISKVSNSHGGAETCSSRDLERAVSVYARSPCTRSNNMVGILQSSLSQTSLEDEPPRKRLCRHQNETFRCRAASFDEPGVEQPVGTTSTPSTRRLSELTVTKVDDQSTSTTASPSQAMIWRMRGSPNARTVAQTPTMPVTIDLISPSTEQHSEVVPSSPTPCKPTICSESTNKVTNYEHRKTDMYTRIYDLPYEVNPPAPLTANGCFNTHITSFLEAMAKRLPLTKYFRPLQVSRDVRALERGHWRMMITVAPFSVVDRARAPITGEEIGKAISERFSQNSAGQRFLAFSNHIQNRRSDAVGSYDDKNKDRARGMWTEEEYVGFWKNMSQFVRDGKAGWGTRLVREEVTNDHPIKGADAELVKIRLRIFTWGEVIGHIWLTIWILSNKLSERIEMEWVAGDGGCVVRMGSRRRYCTLGPWINKGNAGEGAFWGISSEV